MSLAVPIDKQEYELRRARLLEKAEIGRGDCMVWWDVHRIFYLSGFACIPTERPIALIVNHDGHTVLFAPRLELEHAQAYAAVDHVAVYPEFPDREHPMRHLTRVLGNLNVTGRILGDGDGYPKVMGYWGPSLSEVAGISWLPFESAIEDMMQVKSDTEIALVRESARWASRALALLQQHTQPGLSETEVEMRASLEAGQEMLAAYGSAYRALSWGGSGPQATYRGQIGEHGFYPHALNVGSSFKHGDTVIGESSCPMFGYTSELERTMFVGEPSSEQRRLFRHMVALQDLAIYACRGGQTCRGVDERVRDYYERNDLQATWRHHTGHNIGIRYHEGPFLDVGDDTVLEPGMLFTVEPGIYVAGLGGFRHSDTILVTDGAPELLTDYPRDIASLTLAS